MNKTNVIDLNKYKKNKKLVATEKQPKAPENFKADVLSLVEKLEQKTKSERRKVSRTVLSQFIGIFVVNSNGILQPVSIHDLSIDGLSFDMAQHMGAYNVEETITLRIYLSHDTYFSFSSQVTNVRLVESRGVNRHGVLFKKDQPEALYHFVNFLETVSQITKKDKGERLAGRVD
jgi:hypothetical protein